MSQKLREDSKGLFAYHCNKRVRMLVIGTKVTGINKRDRMLVVGKICQLAKRKNWDSPGVIISSYMGQVHPT